MKFPPRQILKEVAEKHHVHPSHIVGKRRTRHLVRARVEVAQRLTTERKLSTSKIAQLLNRDHTTIVYYLGRGSKKPRCLRPTWRKPVIAHLGHARCALCYFGSWAKPPRATAKKRYLAPYAGADRETYEWKEVPRCTSSDA